jgi:putative NIF3 family GTP cyclohydrolase 1 type 2
VARHTDGGAAYRCEEAGWWRPCGGGGGAGTIRRRGADVIVSGSASYDRLDPARDLDLMIQQLSHHEEALDGKR